MKNTKKSIIIFGAVAIALLMVSSATAVPQVNSEPVMEKIEELERLMGEQNLDGLFNFEGMDEESIQEAIDQLNNFLIEQGIDGFDAQEMYTDFSVDDFMDYMTSDGFADFFNHDDIQNLLNSDDYNNYIINNETTISLLNTEFWSIFLNCDFAQEVLDNINGGDDSVTIVRQTTQTQQSPRNTGRGNVILESMAKGGLQQLTQTSEEDANTLFDAMLVGLLAHIIINIIGDDDPEPTPIFIGMILALLFGFAVALGAIAAVVVCMVVVALLVLAAIGIVIVGGVALVVGGIIVVILVITSPIWLPIYIILIILDWLFGDDE